jgi:hypothetical protein
MYKLDFTDDDLGRKRYEICTQALILTGKVSGGKTVAVSEWDEVVDLLKALKAAGTKSKQLVGGAALYDLNEGGSVVFLEKAEHKLLLDFVKQPMWVPEGVEDAREVVKWLEELKYERGKKNPFESAETRRQKAAEANGSGSETVEQLEDRLKLLRSEVSDA